jgi:hypothetical protein
VETLQEGIGTFAFSIVGVAQLVSMIVRIVEDFMLGQCIPVVFGSKVVLALVISVLVL